MILWLLERWRAVAILTLTVTILVSLPPIVRRFYGGTQRFWASRRADALELRYPILWRIGGIVLAIPFIGAFFLLGRLKGIGLAFGVMLCLTFFALAVVGNLDLWTTRFLVRTNSITKIAITRETNIALSEVRSVEYLTGSGKLVFRTDATSLDVPIALDGFGEFARIVLATLPQFITTDATRSCLESFRSR